MKTNALFLKNPIVLAIGFFCFTLLSSACESAKTPAQVTATFWRAISEKNLSLAKHYCNTSSQTLLDTPTVLFDQTTFAYGKIVIEGKHATVETRVSPLINKRSSFTTVLIQEENHWKVDYQHSVENLSGNSVNAFFQELHALGNNINQQLEQQLPILEKEINAIEKTLKQHIEEFTNELKNALPEEQNNPYQNTI